MVKEVVPLCGKELHLTVGKLAKLQLERRYVLTWCTKSKAKSFELTSVNQEVN